MLQLDEMRKALHPLALVRPERNYSEVTDVGGSLGLCDDQRCFIWRWEVPVTCESDSEIFQMFVGSIDVLLQGCGDFLHVLLTEPVIVDVPVSGRLLAVANFSSERSSFGKLPWLASRGIWQNAVME